MVGSLQLSGTTLASIAQQLPATPVEKSLVAIVALAVVVFVGRFILGVAWKLVRIGIVVVGILWLVSVAAPQLL
ncbi:hypothetical protein BRC81_10510 [Halobacteriales archaeon QS_1_68_20]|nr:MAG: hypothetical protein BRC81_10510 [Halobacteriales archaeon QS_1_68_20]